MKVCITYYRDIPMTKKDYAAHVGGAVQGVFESGEEIESVTFIPFDKLDYAKWLGDRSDTQDNRAIWAGEKLQVRPTTQQELADYLGVTKGAVSQYDPKKRKLMLLGLAVLKMNESV